MTLTDEETEALSTYFDTVNLNITRLIKEIGLKKTRAIERILDALIEFDKTNK